MAVQVGGSTPVAPFDPRLNADPLDILEFRRPRPPAIFSVQIGVIGETLIFVLGDDPNGIGRIYNVSRYEVYFVEVRQWMTIAADSVSGNTRVTGGELVGQVSAVGGGKVTLVDHNYFFRRGWFFAVSIIGADFRSAPSNLVRSPSLVDIASAAIPPNVSAQTITKTTETINERTISVLKAACVVPSESHGVVAVAVTNGGSGYTSAPTVVFTGGLMTGGVAATANAVVSPAGNVTAVLIATTGGPYGSAPDVSFTGGAGAGAAASAVLGFNTAFDGFQLYWTNYFGEAVLVEGPFFSVGSARPGEPISGIFNLVPDPGHTTTFSFVSVSAAGSRNPAGAPTVALIV